jgi:tetratricopeptide (TPR) repeat protein
MVLGAPAAAQSRPDGDAPRGPELVRATELKKRGDELMRDRKYQDALNLYNEAFAISADPALHYNRARAYEALAEYPAALDSLDRFARTAPPELKARVPKLDELFADLRGRVAAVVVECDVPGARILVRDKLEGTTPTSEALRVRAGPATVDVLADGYVSFHRQIDLPGAATTTISVNLVKATAATMATLSIATQPGGGLVFIDDKPLGPAPVETSVDPGRHALRVRQDGYEDARLDPIWRSTRGSDAS